jgi:glycosyltransferase involved in cell wall biosynthesis
MNNIVNSITIIPRRTGLLSACGFDPYQMKSRRDLKSAALSDTSYDIAILEGEYVSYILQNTRLKAKRIILRIHNNESRYFRELGQSVKGPIKKLYYISESMKFRMALDKIHNSVDSLCFVSLSEYESASMENSEWVPMSINIGALNEHSRNSKTVLFVGSLFMPNNLEGIRWYINTVHNKLLDIPDYSLCIAGNTHGVDVDRYIKGDRISFYDSPNKDQIDSLYKDASVFIAPMFHGAGVKIKVINAIVSGLPVVATNTSNEGNGLKADRDILVSDDPLQFAEYVRSLLECRQKREELVYNSQKVLSDNYYSGRFVQYISEQISFAY